MLHDLANQIVASEISEALTTANHLTICIGTAILKVQQKCLRF